MININYILKKHYLVGGEEAVSGNEDIMAVRHDKEISGMTRRLWCPKERGGDLAILRPALNDSVSGGVIVNSGVGVDGGGIDCKLVRQHEGNVAEGQSAMAWSQFVASTPSFVFISQTFATGLATGYLLQVMCHYMLLF